MTDHDKKNILQFITHTGMFISPVDDKNVVSFIHGYELGTQNRCDFTQLSKVLLIDKYRINYRNDGWPGQITRLAKKDALSWVTTLKRIALEVVTDRRNGLLDEASTEILKERIVSLIGRVNPLGHLLFDDSWTEEWLSLCVVKNEWFKHLWTSEEWTIVKSIDKYVQADKVFRKKGDYIPTTELLKLKDQFDWATKKTGT